MTNRETYKGPALFSYGFRPFFLSAALFAMLAIPMWWLVWRGDLALASRLNPVDWHIHEMIFGYGAAVVAGFLFTAVPNWTGRLPTRGGPLMLLLSFWIAGRVAVAGLTGQGPFVVALIDQLFLLAVTLMIAREIVAGRNWRNLKVLVPVTLLWLANILFHAEAAMQGTADHGRRLGIALLIFLVMLIGGRIVPSFTRNWLVQRGETRLPVGFSRFDALCLAAGAAGLIAWVVAPYTMICAVFGTTAAVLHLVRVARWRGAGTWRSPLLLMLHVAYLMVPLGFAAVALAGLGLVAPASGAHVLGIGAVGGMTVAVMMRATMGHTGRPLEAGRVLSGAFVLMIAAAAARVAGPAPVVAGLDGIDLSAFLWTCAFALLVARIGPWLLRPKAGRKVPRAAARVAIHDQ
ncbi:short-chain dehydrogenase (plasmid) [Sagittula sp. P11]|uniref:NnrS family protein n=1 Tax=Sagittula sp. P11 TaxID=2009329 RepID=UPI000C2D1EF3|nr:NnrS family protein [Sagittula sp. P11]AUC56202.1 short-chain dehydrogenase [Sagittula sp. P11]